LDSLVFLVPLGVLGGSFFPMDRETV